MKSIEFLLCTICGLIALIVCLAVAMLQGESIASPLLASVSIGISVFLIKIHKNLNINA